MTKRSNRLTRKEYYIPRNITTKRYQYLGYERFDKLHEVYPLSIERGFKYRQLMEFEFDKIERSRIEDVKKWHQQFMALSVNSKLPPVEYFCLEPRLEASQRNIINNMGFIPAGLSALQKSPHIPLLGLFYKGERAPSPYHLIRINSSRKKIIQFDPKLGYGTYCIEIFEWEKLPYENIYMNMDYEKGILLKIITENLIRESSIADSLASPIIGAPNSLNKGGIALSSFGGKGSFVDELMKLIQSLTPPPYRIMKPPLRDEKGYLQDIGDGIKFRFATRPYGRDSIVDSLFSESYQKISDRLTRRETSMINEYSVFSTLIDLSKEHQTAINELFTNFSKTEVTIPEYLNELPESDMDIENTRKALNEDVYIEVVALHHKHPVFLLGDENFISKKIEDLKNHCKIRIEDELTTRKLDLVDPLLVPTVGSLDSNLRRLSQHISRKQNSQIVDEDDVDEAFGIIKHNFESIISQTDVKNALDGLKRSESRILQRLNKEEKGWYPLVRKFLIDNPGSKFEETLDGIAYHSISSDPLKLRRLLDKLISMKLVIYNPYTSTYSWVL